jgi:DegV family protein with EDD domain
MPGIVARLEDKAARTHSFAALDTLEYLRRSGRLTRLQSGLGTLLSVKPLLRMHAGELTMERVRTRRRVVERLIDLVSALGRLEQLALVHTHAPERAEALRRRALHLFPDGVSSLSEEVTPVIGSHVGPGAVGLVGVQAKS